MDAERANIITDFEKKAKKITQFEENYKKQKQLIKNLTVKCQDLERKINLFEKKSSKDEIIASQLKDWHAQIKQYEKTTKELNKMNSGLRSALEGVRADKIKLEDELNRIKSEHSDINALKIKLSVLEETVITQQKELIEKNKILKGYSIDESGSPLEDTLQKFIVGKIEMVKEFNRLIEKGKFRIFVVVPEIENLQQLTPKFNEKIEMRIATSFNLRNQSHKDIIDSYPNAEFRNYKEKDRWGIECDNEEICLVAISENKDFIGISSSDSRIYELFSKLLTEAWLKGEKIPP